MRGKAGRVGKHLTDSECVIINIINVDSNMRTKYHYVHHFVNTVQSYMIACDDVF